MEYFDRMRQVRQAAGDSQSKAAEAIDVLQQHYSRYENGIHEIPLRRLVAFCRHYKVSADWILGLNKKEEVD